MTDACRPALVVFTAQPLRPVHRTLIERLAREPSLALRAIVVAHPAGGDGAGGRLHVVRHAVYDRFHPPLHDDDGAGLGHVTGALVYELGRDHGRRTAALLTALRPDVGLVLGGPTPPPQYFRHGIVVVRARSCTGTVAVSLQHEGEGVPGVVLAETTFELEDADTSASVRIKIDLAGARMCETTMPCLVTALRANAPVPALRAVDAALAPCGGDEPVTAPAQRTRRRSRLVRMRLMLQYTLLLPQLAAVRDRLVRARRAPVCILYYHLVTNQRLNHMCVPLEDFVEQVDFLRRHFGVISLDEAVRRLRSGENQQVAAAITFDDGYRDNAWAVEYLRYFRIPASFFISIGHVLDGTPFEHDRVRGFSHVAPMTVRDVRRLAEDGFLIGSHAMYHEDFGALDAETTERVLVDSRRLIGEVTGQDTEHFSFPKGKRGTNINAHAFALALKHYCYVYSAYGGYNFPVLDRRHFLRVGNPTDALDVAMTMDGYTGGRDVLAGNAWGLKTNELAPY